MRTSVYQPACVVILLVVCLMFAPARLVTGDRVAYSEAARPAEAPVAPAPKDRSFADLCRDDPLAAVALSLERYRETVEGYTCTLAKQERVNGKLKKPELLKCDFRESPFAVRIEWLEGQDRAAVMLYPAKDPDRLAVVPARARWLGYVTRPVNDKDVRAAARFPVTEFGLYHGTARVHRAWRAAQERGALHTRYDGLVPVPELGGMKCHALHRDCRSPEEDGQTAITLYFDPDTLLQVGTIVMAGEELVGSYYFRDVKLNPPFAPDHFALEKLK